MSGLAKERAAIAVIAALVLSAALRDVSGFGVAKVLGAVAGAVFCWWFVGWRRPPEKEARGDASDR